MILIAIVAVAWFALFLYLAKREFYYGLSFSDMMWAGFFALLIAGISMTPISIALSNFAPVEINDSVTEIPIVSLADGDATQTNGSGFITLSITSDNYSYYNYFVRRDDGSYVRRQIDAEDAAIVETNEGEPHLQQSCHTEDLQATWYSPWTFHEVECSYVFYVPVGSVIQQFELDSE